VRRLLLGDDIRQHMAFEADDHVPEGQLLFFKPLHLDLVGKILINQLFDTSVKRAMSCSELTKLAFNT